jgi:cell wall-associated NlpC family hydrolase
MPNVGDYFVVRTNGWAGWLIRIGTGSKWNHAGIYIGDGKIVEARPVGVTISDLSKYNGMPIIWNTTVDNLTPDVGQHIANRAKMFVGDRYGFWSILNIALKILFLGWFPNLKRAEDENSVICSQLVAWSYSVGGIKVSKKQHALVTPKDLAYRVTEK